MSARHHFIDPVDILFLRGNKLFGEPGSFGESLVPPWPSVAAGALRSALLAHRGIDFTRYGAGEVDDPELGTPERPGTFTLTAFHLARRKAGGQVEPLFQPPADLVVHKREDGALEARRRRPQRAHEAIHCSRATPSLAVLAEDERGKQESGLWLNAAGWRRHLAGGEVEPCTHLLSSAALWRTETRVGVGLDPTQRRAADGQLFSMQAVTLRKAEHGLEGEERCDIGFLAETAGAEFPETFTLRFGGDGRAAVAAQVEANLPEFDYDRLATARRCRILLTTPGLFEGGWKPTGATGDDRELRFELHGVRARLVCATVPRAEVISGFDLAKRRPKPAQRVAPTGSVYWLDDLDATPEALRNLAARGLWSEVVENATRRAEGFNRIALGIWSP